MKCEECEYRFKCFTLATTERPKKVSVNWLLSQTCGKCKNSTFGVTTRNNRTTSQSAGYCQVMEMIIHKDSAACDKDNFEPRKLATVDKVYKEIREVLNQKNRRTKLPKFCAIEE